jgi:hypothetical protein
MVVEFAISRMEKESSHSGRSHTWCVISSRESKARSVRDHRGLGLLLPVQ